MKTNASAFLQGYMNKEAGIGSLAKGVARQHAGKAVKGGLAAGAAYGVKKTFEGADKLIKKTNASRGKKIEDATGEPKEKSKPTPAVRSNRKG